MPIDMWSPKGTSQRLLASKRVEAPRSRARTVMSQRRSRVGRRTKSWRREWDSNPRKSFHPSHAFQACALGQTMRSLPAERDCITGECGPER